MNWKNKFKKWNVSLQNRQNAPADQLRKRQTTKQKNCQQTWADTSQVRKYVCVTHIKNMFNLITRKCFKTNEIPTLTHQIGDDFFSFKNDNIKHWWGGAATKTLENHLTLSSKFKDVHIETSSVSLWNICPRETCLQQPGVSYKHVHRRHCLQYKKLEPPRWGGVFWCRMHEYVLI